MIGVLVIALMTIADVYYFAKAMKIDSIPMPWWAIAPCGGFFYYWRAKQQKQLENSYGK